MKKLYSLLTILLITTINFYAQAPEKMNYQAVIRNTSNLLLKNKTIGMQISILQGETSVYEERQTPTTNINGLIGIEIGTGIVISGKFNSIDWGNGIYFIKTETDPEGGTNYTITGKSQILSVPYAMFSKVSENGLSVEQRKAIEVNSEKYSNIYIDSIINGLKNINDELSSKVIENSLKIQSNKYVQNEKFSADIQMNIIYGQSLAIAGSTVSEENFYTTKTFGEGTLILADPDQNQSEINNEELQETRFVSISDMPSTGNGLNARMLNKKWNELLISENGKDLSNFNFNLFGFATGKGGTPWYELAKWNERRTLQYVDVKYNEMPNIIQIGTRNEGRLYTNLMQGIYFAKKFANKEGKSFNVSTLSWVQGESSDDKENSLSQYYNKLEQIFNDINEDVKKITGQFNDVQFIIYQNSSFAIYQDPRSEYYAEGRYSEGVPLASLKIVKEKDNVHFGTPLYPYSPSQDATDKTHLQNRGYALMSSMFGIQAKRVITDENPNITFYPRENEITTFTDGVNWFTKVPFDAPVKPIVFDVDGVSGINMRGHGLQPNYGFSILNDLGTEIITNVRISTNDSVIITTNADPTGLDLTYARTGVYGGGNLRDSQGETITTSFNSITYRCDNWCPFFRISL